MIRELWLKVENVQRYLEEEQRIMHVLSEKEAEREDGYRVVLYVENTRNIKKLRRWVLVDEALINDIKQILGDETVRVVQKEEPEDEFRRTYKNYINEMHYVPGVDEDMRVELMKIQRLDRIADVLEDISSSLISMSEPIESLAECVDVSPARYGGREYTFLHIGGSVDAGV